MQLAGTAKPASEPLSREPQVGGLVVCNNQTLVSCLNYLVLFLLWLQVSKNKIKGVCQGYLWALCLSDSYFPENTMVLIWALDVHSPDSLRKEKV